MLNRASLQLTSSLLKASGVTISCTVIGQRKDAELGLDHWEVSLVHMTAAARVCMVESALQASAMHKPCTRLYP